MAIAANLPTRSITIWPSRVLLASSVKPVLCQTMGTFDLEWLDLREQADKVARDRGLLRAAARWFDGRDGKVLDLGCGSGSTWRAFAPALRKQRSWVLLDNDPRLLEAAASRIGGGAKTMLADLRKVDAIPLDGVRLVTASALLDLVSEEWIKRLARRLADGKVGLYACLNYDGVMSWPHTSPLDDAVVAAFNAHQMTDKGFGPALGPTAWNVMTEALQELGYRVRSEPSAWLLDETSIDLTADLLKGVAGAAGEMGVNTDSWRDERLKIAAAGMTVGHVDLLALPPE